MNEVIFYYAKTAQSPFETGRNYYTGSVLL